MSDTPLVSMGKMFGLSGSALVQPITSPEEVDGYRSFAEALKERSTIFLTTKRNSKNGTSFSFKAQVTMKVASCFSPGGGV